VVTKMAAVLAEHLARSWRPGVRLLGRRTARPSAVSDGGPKSQWQGRCCLAVAQQRCLCCDMRESWVHSGAFFFFTSFFFERSSRSFFLSRSTVSQGTCSLVLNRFLSSSHTLKMRKRVDVGVALFDQGFSESLEFPDVLISWNLFGIFAIFETFRIYL
jgi:hypothetical protein